MVKKDALLSCRIVSILEHIMSSVWRESFGVSIGWKPLGEHEGPD